MTCNCRRGVADFLRAPLFSKSGIWRWRLSPIRRRFTIATLKESSCQLRLRWPCDAPGIEPSLSDCESGVLTITPSGTKLLKCHRTTAHYSENIDMWVGETERWILPPCRIWTGYSEFSCIVWVLLVYWLSVVGFFRFWNILRQFSSSWRVASYWRRRTSSSTCVTSDPRLLAPNFYYCSASTDIRS